MYLATGFQNLLPVGYRLFFIDYALCLSLKLQHFDGLFFLSLSVPYNRSLSIDDDLCRTPPQNPSHNITENLRFRSLKEGKNSLALCHLDFLGKLVNKEKNANGSAFLKVNKKVTFIGSLYFCET